jgi:hypothetical protein
VASSFVVHAIFSSVGKTEIANTEVMSGAVVSPAVIVLTTGSVTVVVVAGAVSIIEGVLIVGVGSGVGVDTGAGAGAGVEGAVGTLVSTVTSPKASTGAACNVKKDRTRTHDKNLEKLRVIFIFIFFI